MVYAVIFAGGVGRRMTEGSAGSEFAEMRGSGQPASEQIPANGGTDIPKQFLMVGGKPIIIRTLMHFEEHPAVDGIVIACLPDWIPRLSEMLREYHIRKVTAVVPGGETGYLSIHNGLMALAESGVSGADIILICDGVRPILTERLITEAIDCAENYGSAVPVMPSIDSLLFSENGETSGASYERNKMFITQAPQGYRMEKILWAHDEAEKRNWHDAVSSSELLIGLGEEVHLFRGERANIKITTKEDLEILRANDCYRNILKMNEKQA